MKAVRIHEHGGTDVLVWEEISDHVIRPDQALVKIKALYSLASIGSNLAGVIFKVGMWIILWPNEKSFPIKSSASINGLVIKIFIFF